MLTLLSLHFVVHVGRFSAPIYRLGMNFFCSELIRGQRPDYNDAVFNQDYRGPAAENKGVRTVSIAVLRRVQG